MLAMVIFDWDGRKEVRARDVVPTLANLHATPERVAVRKLQQLEYGFQQLRR